MRIPTMEVRVSVLCLGLILHLNPLQCTSKFHADQHVAVKQEQMGATEAPSQCSLLECVDATLCFGTDFCICPTNYQWLVGTELCIDIDECVEDPTACVNAHTCVNLGGSYECGCNEGWILTLENTCEEDTAGPKDYLRVCSKYHVFIEDGVTFMDSQKGCDDNNLELLSIPNEIFATNIETYLQGIDINYSLDDFWYMTKCGENPNSNGQAGDTRDGYICGFKN